jgi:hypothetical protein
VNDSSGGGRVRIAQSSSADEKEIPEEEGEEEEASLSIDDLKTSLRTSLEGVLSFPLSYFAASCPMGFFFFFFLMYRILFLSYELLLLDVSEIVLGDCSCPMRFFFFLMYGILFLEIVLVV